MVIEDNIKFNKDFSTRLQKLLKLDETAQLNGVLRGFRFSNFVNVGGVASFELSHGFCVINNIILEKQKKSKYSFIPNSDKYIYIKFVYSLSWKEPTGTVVFENRENNSDRMVLIGTYNLKTNILKTADHYIENIVQAKFADCSKTFERKSIPIENFFINENDRILFKNDDLPHEEQSQPTQLHKIKKTYEPAINHPNIYVKSIGTKLFIADKNHPITFITNGVRFDTLGTDLYIDLDNVKTKVGLSIKTKTVCVTDSSKMYIASNINYPTDYDENIELPKDITNTYIKEDGKIYQDIYELDFIDVGKGLLDIDLTGYNSQYHPVYNPKGQLYGIGDSHWTDKYDGVGVPFFKNLPIERTTINIKDRVYNDYVKYIEDTIEYNQSIVKNIYSRKFYLKNNNVEFGKDIILTKELGIITKPNKSKGVLWQH